MMISDVLYIVPNTTGIRGKNAFIMGINNFRQDFLHAHDISEQLANKLFTT